MLDVGKKTVIVVGGGLAGIAAALALARQGVRVRVIEAHRRLGGRTGSFTIDGDSSQGSTQETVDYCQHVGMGCCVNLKQLIGWLGQRDQWIEHKALHFYGSDGKYRRLSALPFVPAPLHLLSWLAFWPNLGIRDRLATARGLLAIKNLKLEQSLESQFAADWLRAHGQTENGMRQFWNTIIVSALGEELSRVNLAAVCKVLQDGFLNHREAFHLLVPKKPLDQLFNHGAAAKLRELGVEIDLGARVSAVSREAGRVVVVSQGVAQTADAVVIAIPWHQLSKLTAEPSVPLLVDIAQCATQLGASPITGVHTWWDRDWMPHPHAAIVGRVCQWVFADSAQGDVPPYYYQIVISASRTLPKGDPRATERLLLDDLSQVFPDSRKAKLLRFKVVTDPLAVFSVSPESLECRATPGALGEDILLAGDWTRSGWPATMEGAVLSGFRAAEAVLDRWGHSMQICSPAMNGRQLKGD